MEYIELYHVFPWIVRDGLSFIYQLGRLAHGDSTGADCFGQYEYLLGQAARETYKGTGPPRLLRSLVLEVPGI